MGTGCLQAGLQLQKHCPAGAACIHLLQGPQESAVDTAHACSMFFRGQALAERPACRPKCRSRLHCQLMLWLECSICWLALSIAAIMAASSQQQWLTADADTGSGDISTAIDLGQWVCSLEGHNHAAWESAAQPSAVGRVALLAQPAQGV